MTDAMPAAATRIELRITTQGECDCGPLADHWNTVGHQHGIECDWGTIEHPNPRPDRDEVGPLMLITRSYVDMLLSDGPVLASWGSLYSAQHVDGQTFLNITHDRHWMIWALHPAHWANQPDWPAPYVGRWPD